MKIYVISSANMSQIYGRIIVKNNKNKHFTLMLIDNSAGHVYYGISKEQKRSFNPPEEVVKMFIIVKRPRDFLLNRF